MGEKVHLDLLASELADFALAGIESHFPAIASAGAMPAGTENQQSASHNETQPLRRFCPGVL